MHIDHCLVVPKQYQFKKYKNCFVLMQLHLMLNIFVCDIWLALWIFFFEKLCSKIFGKTLQRQKGGDLTQSYDKSPYTHGNVKRAVTTQTTPQKSSIKQRLRTDLGRSVGVTTATQLVWLTWFTGPTFPLPATAV